MMHSLFAPVDNIHIIIMSLCNLKELLEICMSKSSTPNHYFRYLNASEKKFWQQQAIKFSV